VRNLGYYIMTNFMVYIDPPVLLNCKIKDVTMCWTHSMNGGDNKCIWNFDGQSSCLEYHDREGKIILGWSFEK
jgi:hypothetical protein